MNYADSHYLTVPAKNLRILKESEKNPRESVKSALFEEHLW